MKLEFRHQYILPFIYTCISPKYILMKLEFRTLSCGFRMLLENLLFFDDHAMFLHAQFYIASLSKHLFI